MIKIIDTFDKIPTLFEEGKWNGEKWEKYINSIYENSAHLFEDEVKGYIASGKYTFEKNFLPIIQNVYQNEDLTHLHDAFVQVTKNLDQKVKQKFHRELNVDIVLYLGLCNAAGWVTNINDRDTVLLGIEKILELKWFDLETMYALVYHELGHVYQAQYGLLEQESQNQRKNTVWQLFTEGIAMYFEQSLVGDFEHYHQDKNGWKNWCESHLLQILEDFDRDISTTTRYGQRYFGDWCDYNGYSNVGYYLGTKFVHDLVAKTPFDELITLDIDSVYCRYQDFVARKLQ